MKRLKRAFTLLEVLVAMMLLVSIASLIGWKMSGLIAKKQFRSQLEQLYSRITVCHQLALNTQTDWKGVLRLTPKGWVFETFCEEASEKIFLTQLSLFALDFKINGKKGEKIEFYFTSSGRIFPHGILSVRGAKKEFVSWKLPDIFFQYEGKGKGPIRPNEMDLKKA